MMTNLVEVERGASEAVVDRQRPLRELPSRLHHNAWVVEDQERTRAFYEDVLGFPLTQFWIEGDEGPGGDRVVLSHAFYGLADGSALAFFSMADPAKQDIFRSPKTEIFNHIALKVSESTQDEIIERLTNARYQNFSIEHGYCRSVYAIDPDGLRLEFTLDSPDVARINDLQLRTAHASLRRWLSGDRRPNNDVRPH